jgi:hypothetical protein
MSETPKDDKRVVRADLMMVLLCGITSYWLLASPLVPYVFADTAAGLIQFVLATLVLTFVLASIGIKLNHLAARNVRVSIGRGRRRS